MLREKLLHPATIISVIALFVALSGVGYAATKIGTAQLKNNAVTTAKIKNGAVDHALRDATEFHGAAFRWKTRGF